MSALLPQKWQEEGCLPLPIVVEQFKFVSSQGFEPTPVVAPGSRSAICFSLVNGEYHRITGFLPNRWYLHVDERNGTERRIPGKSVAIVNPP
jgi:hypothetical protein